eukprot:GCRY01007578.1.p1 GENE.GCRY01007578.1~~GCRY01007578.1.p1  ORF type:complete len:422 (+),score=80.86 GCRY01007578.1:123-1388(+)
MSSTYSHNDWTCEKCGCQNFARRNECFDCGVARPTHLGIGEGQREGDWFCQHCEQRNFAKRTRCFKCDQKRPVEEKKKKKNQPQKAKLYFCEDFCRTGDCLKEECDKIHPNSSVEARDFILSFDLSARISRVLALQVSNKLRSELKEKKKKVTPQRIKKTSDYIKKVIGDVCLSIFNCKTRFFYQLETLSNIIGAEPSALFAEQAQALRETAKSDPNPSLSHLIKECSDWLDILMEQNMNNASQERIRVIKTQAANKEHSKPEEQLKSLDEEKEEEEQLSPSASGSTITFDSDTSNEIVPTRSGSHPQMEAVDLQSLVQLSMSRSSLASDETNEIDVHKEKKRKREATENEVVGTKQKHLEKEKEEKSSKKKEKKKCNPQKEKEKETNKRKREANESDEPSAKKKKEKKKDHKKKKSERIE